MSSGVSYFRRRLAETQRWSDAPPIMRYQAAASTVDDDTLERSGEPFGAKYGESGFGTSEVFQELLSKDPTYVPVADLSEYQQGLIDTGYLPQTYTPTGAWDADSANADRRASRDAFNTSRSGGSFMASSVQTLFRYLGHTVPTSVFDGMYGIAQGIVSDAATAATNPVEVLEEGGFLGSAAVGAGIGAGIGTFVLPVIGTGVGAAIGGLTTGVAGFFADLFDDDEDEEGNWQQIVGALSPIDEIRSGDAKNLFAALSTIMTASAVLKSVQVARAGAAAAGGAKQLTMRSGWQMASRDQVAPGLFNQMTQAGLKHRTMGTAVLGGTLNAGQEILTTGDFGQAFRDFGTGMILGAGVGKFGGNTKLIKNASESAVKHLDKAPLARIAASPAGKVSQALYTGMSAPTIVARALGEMSQTQIGTDKNGKPIYESGTAVGRDIDEADFKEKLGPVGTAIDFTVGSLIFPSRLTPWKADDVVKGMKAMGSGHALLPFAGLARNVGTKTLGMQDAMRAARDKMGWNPITKQHDDVLLGARAADSYVQFAIESRATAALQQKIGSLPAPKNAYDRLRRSGEEARILMEERSKIKASILEEAQTLGKETDLVTTPLGKELLEEAMANPQGMQNFMAAKGFDMDQWASHLEATEHINRRRSLILAEVDARGPSDSHGLNYTPAVKDEYLVAQDFEQYGGAKGQIGEYEAKATAAKKAQEALDNVDNDALMPQLQAAAVDAKEELATTLKTMKDRGIIDDDVLSALSPVTGELKVEKRLIDYLQETAKTRPRRDDALTEELAGIAGGRYMAVKTGENMLDYTHFVDQSAITGLTEYTRTKGFWDGLSSLGAKVDKADVGALRYQSIVRHLDKTAGELLTEGDGKAVADKIYDFVKLRYDETALKRRLGKEATLEVKLGSFIRIEDGQGKVTRELFKVDPRDLNVDDIVQALSLTPKMLKGDMDVYEAADRIKRSLHVGAAFGADVAHPVQTARSLGASLKLNGLTGFNDFMRTTNFVPAKFGAKGSATGKFKKGSYGYLPQHLRRVHMALQFSLSPTFDASRFAEAWMFGKMRGGDIPIKAAGQNPKKWVGDYEEGWISPNTGQRISGKQAQQEMIEFGDRVLYGRAMNANFDELQLRLLNRGVLGFKPREVEYAQAWWMGQKKLAKREGGQLLDEDLADIRETIMQIGQYGTKQTSFGNSMHFVFFPFLFSRKQASALVDFTLGAPTRNLLLHEGLRRWYEVSPDGESMSSEFAGMIEKYAPVLGEIGRLNNLAYGVSPGRFFLEGIVDKDAEGKIAQGLTSFLLPGGVHSTLGDTAGNLATLAKHAFVPQIWTADSIEAAGGVTGIMQLAERLVPMYRDVNRWFMDSDQYGTEFGVLGAQAKGLGKGTPRAQMGEYLDTKRVLTATLDGLATQSGYSSWESMKADSPELAAAQDDIEGELGQSYPDGQRLASEFTNKDAIKEQTLFDIANKEDRTEAEDAILFIGQLENQAKSIATSTGLTQEEVLRAFSPMIREFGVVMVEDRQFMNLWEGLYRPMFGPLRQIRVA